MKFKHVIGMDMAKNSFVAAIHGINGTKEYDNDPKSIRQMLKTLGKLLKTDLMDCLFCFEHTGLYCIHMTEQLSKQELSFCIISGLEYKKSRGIKRGTSDPIDAHGIAEYAHLRKDTLKLYQPKTEEIKELEHLLSTRAMHVRHRASYISRSKEQFRVLKKTKFGDSYQSQKKIIHVFDKEIDKIEKAIEKLIHANSQISQCFELLTSIKGVGAIVASHMIVKTRCFTAFANWRKFACYCGTAPFPNQSGNKKLPSRISKIGSSEMKTLLTLAARSSIQCDPELSIFYKRKIDQGKSRKNAMNAVRNKLIARMFSVVKRGTPYVVMNKFAA